MLFASIVWNYFDGVPTEICTYLNNLSLIKEVFIIGFDSDFEKFVKDVYSRHEIKDQYVTNKILELKKLPNRDVLLITHEILEPELCYDTMKHTYYSQKCKILKKEIRKAFDQNYNCFDHSHIIHCTDNEVETLALLKILEKYSSTCTIKIIPSSGWNVSS